MARSKHPFTPADIARAREMRIDGASWEAIGAVLTCHAETIRRRLDGDYKLRRAGRYAGPQTFIRVGVGKVPEADAIRALAAVPGDTRSLQARLMGDPLPGRSALDRRLAQ